MADPVAKSSGSTGGPNNLEFERPLTRIEVQIRELEASQARTGRDYSDQIRKMRAELLTTVRKTYAKLTAWETVMVARHPQRPLTTDYIQMIVKDFCELHGDRAFRDDKAIVTGFGRIAGQKVMLVGHRKGKDTKEKIECCFGCAHPEGYRKALRAMKLAAKFGLPVVSLIDTPGAYPGIGAEERGQAQIIAKNLMEMSLLRTPIVILIIGEGGSGGALGIGVGDRVAVMEHAYYSVISPEGCAAILWKSGEYAQQAAELLKMTSKELKRLDLIDEVIREPLGGAHRNPQQAAANVERYLSQTLRSMKRTKIDTLLERRYKRLRELGSFFESSSSKSNGRSKKANGQALAASGSAARS
ncbi:MAG TPA: acetyl-CoA carboxylase carboxyltransferase subunit alpha [Phycisphaerae bacterium]|nr:acetyl-CoA carboxylase carboxyltransferase subunit alpha [Phycisphaerae bacterium]